MSSKGVTYAVESHERRTVLEAFSVAISADATAFTRNFDGFTSVTSVSGLTTLTCANAPLEVIPAGVCMTRQFQAGDTYVDFEFLPYVANSGTIQIRHIDRASNLLAGATTSGVLNGAVLMTYHDISP